MEMKEAAFVERVLLEVLQVMNGDVAVVRSGVTDALFHVAVRVHTYYLAVAIRGEGYGQAVGAEKVFIAD